MFDKTPWNLPTGSSRWRNQVPNCKIRFFPTEGDYFASYPPKVDLRNKALRSGVDKNIFRSKGWPLHRTFRCPCCRYFPRKPSAYLRQANPSSQNSQPKTPILELPNKMLPSDCFAQRQNTRPDVQKAWWNISLQMNKSTYP